MCGRFDRHTPLAWVAEDYFGVQRPIESQTARYNIAPGTAISTLYSSDGDINFNLTRWGFRPSWAGEDSPRHINTQAERVATSRFFSHAFLHNVSSQPTGGLSGSRARLGSGRATSRKSILVPKTGGGSSPARGRNQ